MICKSGKDKENKESPSNIFILKIIYFHIGQFHSVWFSKELRIIRNHLYLNEKISKIKQAKRKDLILNMPRMQSRI
ncbi:hypothetical protein Glove_184g57 [Diversispora epigaea]|uniref:Uncharacterized protein n=1 Tax=Diversispora epigaea TaxID=1348612 RepID=A0A397IQG0_9GLOM|nr:hypothetical protein Glove_184g57 [Diversispora epigaea]